MGLQNFVVTVIGYPSEEKTEKVCMTNTGQIHDNEQVIKEQLKEKSKFKG